MSNPREEDFARLPEDAAPEDVAEFEALGAPLGLPLGGEGLEEVPGTPEDTERADAAFAELMERAGESSPEPRLHATARVLELLGDPQSAYPVIQLTGTNGKTSTSRMIESTLRAHGLRTGLFTSPHLVRFTERISVDGRPISDAAVADNWEDVRPFIQMVDMEYEARGESRLTFFEALTVLAFACFADAPVDVAVIEVGMGGEWDSTNVADAQIAVLTPIDLDHTARLGRTIAEIAATKSGIIKPGAIVVSAAQPAEALAAIEARAAEVGARVLLQDREFSLEEDTVAVGGQQITVRGRAGTYSELYLPLYGDHQAQNAAVAIAAVEAFLGDGGAPLGEDPLTEGLATATSPGRLQLIGVEPTTIVDAAHNPHGARALREAIRRYFDVDEVALVIGVLSDKDALGILTELEPIATTVLATESESERSIPAEQLAALAAQVLPDRSVAPYEQLVDALLEARDWAGQKERRLVLVTGSIVLGGAAIEIAEDREWKS